MRLATIKLHGAEVAGIVTGKGILPVAALNAYKGTGEGGHDEPHSGQSHPRPDKVV